MNQSIFILKGNIVFTPKPDQFVVYDNSYLISCNGIVTQISQTLPDEYKNYEVSDYENKLIIPGFVDLHTHASQFNQRGLGLDLQLLDWLNEYTFKEESRFHDPSYAISVYEAFAEEVIRQGTTRVVIFATIHKESCRMLIEILTRKGIGAYVGKVNMDCNCPESLQEDTDQSLKDTEELIRTWGDNPLVRPIITPRFAPTSSKKLLAGLGKLAEKYKLPVQSHLSENENEIAWVARLFPEQREYHRVYEHYQLFGQTPTLMAHCVHVTDKCVSGIRENGVIAVHCPDSNLNLASGIMPVRKLLDADVQVGLGTDIGAGHSLSMVQALVKAIQVSKVSNDPACGKPLTLAEAFYMATKGGGQFFGKVGSFEPGFACDALVVDPCIAPGAAFTSLEKLQQFVYTGSSENIISRYCNGKKIKISQ
ncbi:guanine deaminase [Anaerospora sp.]|uniref:guanine deaminase n=1 Tax=Anaerospora sp. TaxID=1960278 RepID=UPI00289B5A28|nr:guanine deaminase [Anaerospora sp.]